MTGRAGAELLSSAPIPSAWMRSRLPVLLGVLVLGLAALWSLRHVWVTAEANGANGLRLGILWVVIFGMLLFHLALAWTNRPARVTNRQRQQLDRLNVAIVVPAYNEDPAALTTALASMFKQTRMPNRIHVVDDGSTASLAAAEEAFYAMGREHPEVDIAWTRTTNRGKRHAHIVAFEMAPDADVFLTVDSDTVLDSRCIEEGMKPFADERVTSVASVILTLNNGQWLARVTDSWFMAWQMSMRAALSRLGAVLVNSGCAAFYRAEVVRDALSSYADEKIRGNTVMFSDDSLLTLFAHLRGRTVQQDTSIAFALQPERVGHHLRQQLRWMRGSTIRSMWRFKYLPVNGWGYWENFANWLNYVLVSLALLVLVFVLPIAYGYFDPWLLAFSVAVCYMTAARYLVIGRSDQSLVHQIGTVALAPLMLAWTALVLRPMRLYAIATCWRTGWGTRSTVEVAA